jgi:hypothetical protein
MVPAVRFAVLTWMPLISAPQGVTEKELAPLVGTWLYAGDVTPGRAVAERTPNYGAEFILRVEGDVLVFERPRSKTLPVLRIPRDSSEGVTTTPELTMSVQGRFADGIWHVDQRKDSVGKSTTSATTYSFKAVEKGLELTVQAHEPEKRASHTCLYRKAADLGRTPVAAKIDTLDWFVGDWSGQRRGASIEEHWIPPAGGALLATSRTVNGGKMTAFEFLRIVEQAGTLVYVAQPGGGTATEFTLVEQDETRAVFENPRHDFPQRIAYTRADDKLTAEISFIDGGQPQRFDFTSAY